MRKFIGIPFEYGGASFQGCDCFGLIQLYWREELGKEFPIRLKKRYSKNDEQATFENVISARVVDFIDEPEPHDIVAFFYKDKYVHLGLYMGDGKVLTTTKMSGSVISRLKRWIFYNYEFLRLKDVR
jgi:cell wall-associated NlpC family hydrolase